MLIGDGGLRLWGVGLRWLVSSWTGTVTGLDWLDGPLRVPFFLYKIFLFLLDLGNWMVDKNEGWRGVKSIISSWFV